MKTIYLGSIIVNDGYNGHKTVIFLNYDYGEDIVHFVHSAGFYSRNLNDVFRIKPDFRFDPVRNFDQKKCCPKKFNLLEN